MNQDQQTQDIIPGEFLIIKTSEQLTIPKNITGRVGEKNSLLRLGLKVDGPQYQPGHVTYAYLRVQNLSDQVITLKKGMKIVQIYFEELKEVPERGYDQQINASFHNEDMSTKIYGNVLTLMGIIAAIFSLLSINYQAFTNADLNANYIIAMNLSLTFCIAVMLGMILFLVNGWRKKGFSIIYGAVIIVLGIAVFVFIR